MTSSSPMPRGPTWRFLKQAFPRKRIFTHRLKGSPEIGTLIPLAPSVRKRLSAHPASTDHLFPIPPRKRLASQALGVQKDRHEVEQP